MADPQPQIQGLPPGAVATPIAAMSAAPQIQGLPPGATAVPIGYQDTGKSKGIPQGTGSVGQGWNSLTDDPWGTVKSIASDLGTGAAQGAANTVGSSIVGIAHLLHKIPAIGQYLSPQEGINALAARTADQSTPQNTTQAIGKGAEQTGEFLLPGVGEEGATAKALPFLSKLGPLAKPLARVGYQAATTGLVNGAQGGSPAVGAATGALGGAVGEGLRAAAPSIAESALGITKRMRGYGKTPGLAALEETSGLAPSTIEQQAQQKIGQLTDGIESGAAAHQGTVSLQPAIDTIDQEISKATAQNNAQAIEQLGRVKDALTKSVVPGAGTLPVDQTAEGALNLKRGLRNQFIKNWNPELMDGTRAVAAHASGAIDNSLDSALGPDFQSANQRVSSLIPVAESSESLTRDPGLAQRVGNRIARPTGALIGSAMGAGEGYREKGLPGAAIGGLTGLVLPEVLSSPGVRMALARTMYNPGALIKLLSGAGLQLDRPSQENQQ